MSRYDRNKLHFGPYRARRFQYGQNAECFARGEVTIIGLSDARIPWPIGWLPGGKSPVLCGPLVKAVQREAACAMCHWWGVSPWLVRKWRRALGVPRWNEGDLRLKVAIGKSPGMKPALDAMHAKARDPVRRAKIAAAKRGVPRPPHVVEGMRQRMLGKKLSKTTRAKMSAAHKARGTWPSAAGKKRKVKP
jgi:hypothetical protein